MLMLDVIGSEVKLGHELVFSDVHEGLLVTPIASQMNLSTQQHATTSLVPSPWRSEQLPKSLLVLTALILIDLTTIVGNLLVVLAVMTTKSLHTVTNSFIVSLACADMLVAVLVMPLSIYTVIYNTWIFGNIVCDLWISCDVMLCTASILNLCCISLDRYFAITRPLSYSRQRSPKLARTMIAVVWISSVLISCPPVFGWGDKNREPNTCTLNLLLSYRIYSSMGSFYVPCFTMVFVYLRIFKVIHDREKYLMKSSSSNTTTFSMPHLKQSNYDDEKNKPNWPTTLFKTCFCCFCTHNNKLSAFGRRPKPMPIEVSLNNNSSSNNKNKNESSSPLPIGGSQSMVCFGATPNKVASYNHKNENFPMSNIILSDSISQNLKTGLNEEDDGMDEELMKNFSSFINDANNRNVSYSVVKKSAVVEQIESINSGIEVLATAALVTVSATETTIATESPNTSATNNTNQMLTNNPSIVIDDDASKSTANQLVKEEDSLNSAAFRLAIPTSAKQKLASRKTKRRLIDFHLFKEKKNSTADDPNRANVTRVKPNNMVARKLASHGTSNSILATVTFMPNSRTKFSSCLTINRNGSMRSVRSLKSLENNSNNESIKEKNRRKPTGQHQQNDVSKFKKFNHLRMHRSKSARAGESGFSKSSSLSSNLASPSNLNLKAKQHLTSPLVRSNQSSTNRSSGSHNQEQMRLIKESKAAKTLAIVVGGFIVSWMPFFVIYVLEAILPTGYISKTLFDWLTWLGYFNSAINPIIYAFYSKQFRSAFYRLTIGKCRRKPAMMPQMSMKNANNNYYYANYYYSTAHRGLANGAKSYSFYHTPQHSNANGGFPQRRKPNDSFYRN